MGLKRVAREVLDEAVLAVNWLRSSLADDNDVEAHVDDAAGNDLDGAAAAEVWTVAGVQSRPKDGSEADGYAKALRVQLGDSVIVIGTHDPRHVEACEPGELVIHALGKDGSLRALVRLKPDGSIDVSGTQVVVGNPDGTLQKIGLGDAIESLFNAWKTWADGHVHPVPAPVSANTTAPTTTSPSTTTLKSSKHSVET